MRKRYISLIVGAVLLIAVSVGATYALLVTSSNAVVNTFTVGGVDITLTETTGDKYIMAPGVTVVKDPSITVIANSESSWLFVKVEKENNFDVFCTYEIQDGWTALDGYDGVFYQKVEKSSSNQVFQVLKNNSIVVRVTVTEEELNAVSANPKLNFTAYAAQSDSLATAGDAWNALHQGKE